MFYIQTGTCYVLFVAANNTAGQGQSSELTIYTLETGSNIFYLLLVSISLPLFFRLTEKYSNCEVITLQWNFTRICGFLQFQNQT